MRRVYICGPISRGDLAHNIQQANRAMLELMQARLAPFNPMLTCFAGGDLERERYADGRILGEAHASGGGEFRKMPHSAWIAVDLAWVEVADAVLRLPGESVGADLEVEHARKHNVPAYFSIHDLLTQVDDDARPIHNDL